MAASTGMPKRTGRHPSANRESSRGLKLGEMISEEALVTLRTDFEALAKDGADYFARCIKLIAEDAAARRSESYYERTRDTVPREELETSANLRVAAARLVARLSAALKGSALLGSEADQGDVRWLGRRLIAALESKEYREWDASVINDEDVVLGMRPAGHEEGGILVKNAKVIFDEAVEKTLWMLSVLEPGAAENPALIVATQPQSSPVTKSRRNTAFVMMWMDKANAEVEDTYETIKRTFKAFDIAAIRADDIEHSDTITKRILDEIATSEFLLADLTGSRPSVYYEIGYAHAIGKRPILYRKKGTALHFDLSVHNCPEYENNTGLEKLLKKRLSALTNKKVAGDED